MAFKKDDLCLKKTVRLYNNIAEFEASKGRLLVEFKIFPTPRLNWEFEVLGKEQRNLTPPKFDRIKPSDKIKGHLCVIEKPYCTSVTFGEKGPQELKGIARNIIFGNLNAPVNSIVFYLPNAYFQYKSIKQKMLMKKIHDREKRLYGGSGAGRLLEFQIDDDWDINLKIEEDSLGWLDRKKRNIGTLITSEGHFYSHEFSQSKKSLSQTISFKKGLSRLKSLGTLLSYANGGYISPLYIEGHKLNENSFNIPSAIAQSTTITPLEQLSESWITWESEIKTFIKCLPSFERMIQKQGWKDTFEFILIQYFLATNRSSSWPVAASAVGAALERLSYIILIEEETNNTLKNDIELLFDRINWSQARVRWKLGKGRGKENISPTGKRLRLLLERIGVNKSKRYNDLNEVPKFLKVRNTILIIK